ncbi:MAG TPA: DUF2306 domain-containing protein [Pyrinomonadaceae bacterium]|jgi:hypothetical protein
MKTSNSISPPAVASSFSLTGIILAAGFISSAAAWWLIAFPVATFGNAEKHSGHFGWLFFHMLGGTIMLFLGLSNLYIGTTGKYFGFHKILGRIYLVGGALGAIAAMVIMTSTAHKTAGASVFTNTTISLLTLATAWLVAAGMSYRAVRNGRYDAHRDWIIRSYVLAWSFVFCRLASRVPVVENMGGGTAFIWLSWVAPLIVCEIALQWRDGAGKSLNPATPAAKS